MLSIIGQARAGIQSPALYNIAVTVQDFTFFSSSNLCIYGSVKYAIFAYNFSLHKIRT